MKIKKKRRDGLKRQAEILDLSLHIFATNGYHKTSVEEIIKTAGIAKGTFYLHFEGKKDLFIKLIDDYLSKLYKLFEILDISQSIPIEDLRKKYIEIAKIVVEFPEFRDFTKIILRDASIVENEIDQKLNSFFNKIIEMSADYIENAKKIGRVKKEVNSYFSSLAIVGASKELLMKYVLYDEVHDVEKAIDSTFSLFMSGLLIQE